MTSDPVPPPDGRVIVGFRDVDLSELMHRLSFDDAKAHLDAMVAAPSFRGLLEDVRGAAPGLAVVEREGYDESAGRAEDALIAQLGEARDGAAVRALFDEFERLYPDRVASARSAFLWKDRSARSAALEEGTDTDACVAVLAQAAVDYAVPASWWPEGCERPPDDRERAGRYAALRGGEDCESLYSYLLLDVRSIDPAAEARAPHPPPRDVVRHMGPSIELAEVVSLVVPTLAGVALDKLVDAASSWLRRRRPTPGAKQIVRIYGPGGELLKEVQVTESTASSGT